MTDHDGALDWLRSPESRIEARALQVRQPIGTFYVAVLSAADLAFISRSDIVFLEGSKRELEVLSGIERPLSRKRVAEIAKFVNHIDATFPGAVILAMSSADIDFDDDSLKVNIRRGMDVARILDGQHRIEGLRQLAPNVTFDVIVTIFVEMDVEDQALIFSTINLNQAPVSKSIVYELFEYARSRSPQKTCHTIARILNASQSSAFFGKIMILGTARHKDEETLTQAAFIKPLERMITQDAMSDRDQYRRNKKPVMVAPDVVRVKKLVFRKWFIEGKDEYIAKTIDNYFGAVAARWPTAWNRKEKGRILNRTTGYQALMRFLPLTLFRLGVDTLHSESEFKEIFDQVRLTDDDFSPENFKPGSSGEGSLLLRLQHDTGITDREPWRTQPAAT